MQKIEASKLLIKILNGEILHSNQNALNHKSSLCVVILSDEIIFQKYIEELILANRQKRPQIFEGSQALEQYNRAIRQNNLFEPASDAIILLEDNFAKKFTDDKIYLYENIVFVFGKTGLRHTINEKIFPNAIYYLSYSPNEDERQKCVEILAKKYIHSDDIQAMSEQALLHYNSDLQHCALHFERMQKSGVSFQNAKFFETEISGFDIVSTLLDGSLELLDLRLVQYATNGQEASHLLHILIYFFKQLAVTHAELAQHSNLNIAFKNAKIPYPAQAQIKKALDVIPYSKVEHFFSVCAQLELDLRERKNAHQILFLELSALIE